MPELQDSLEHRIARNTPRLLLIFVVAGIAASVALRAARSSEPTLIGTILRPVLAGAQAFAWTVVAVLLVVLGCAGASLLLRRLLGDISIRATHRILALVVAAAFLAFLFVPMCLGSLSEGTYECLTLFQRATTVIGGA